MSGARGLAGVRAAVRGRRRAARRDPVPRLAMGAVGGTDGAHVAPRRRGPWFPASVLVALSALPLVFAVLQKNNCIEGGWRSPQLIWRMCYSDPVVRWTSSGMNTGAAPWSGPESAMPHVPPLRAALLWLVGVPAGAFPDQAEQQVYFALWVVLLVLALAALVVAVVDWARADGSDPWVASHVALSPLLVPLMLVSDLLVWVALAVWGCVLWRRGRPVSSAVAGVLWVLAVTGLPVLGVLAVVSVVARPSRLRSAWPAMVLAAVVVLVPWWLWNADSLGGMAFWRVSGGHGGVWSIVAGMGADRADWVVQVVSAVGVLLGCLVGGLLVWRAANGREVGAALGAGLLLAVALQPEVPTQMGLLALPFLALAGLGWRTHLAWAVMEGFHFVFVWMHIGRGSNDRVGMPEDGYAVVVAVRLAVWVVLIALLALRSSRGERLQ
ncbi:hypothetical protein [Kytococcus sedentarius]|uniref:hypothetical protein n=1 Tax=Kytococcus sedentarius TaxID=1276 RepID=UPI0035BC3B8B